MEVFFGSGKGPCFLFCSQASQLSRGSNFYMLGLFTLLISVLDALGMRFLLFGAFSLVKTQDLYFMFHSFFFHSNRLFLLAEARTPSFFYDSVIGALRKLLHCFFKWNRLFHDEGGCLRCQFLPRVTMVESFLLASTKVA